MTKIVKDHLLFRNSHVYKWFRASLFVTTSLIFKTGHSVIACRFTRSFAKPCNNPPPMMVQPSVVRLPYQFYRTIILIKRLLWILAHRFTNTAWEARVQQSVNPRNVNIQRNSGFIEISWILIYCWLSITCCWYLTVTHCT